MEQLTIIYPLRRVLLRNDIQFTKQELIQWAHKLIEETQDDISISRTDAHAESYHAQLELLKIALKEVTK